MTCSLPFRFPITRFTSLAVAAVVSIASSPAEAGHPADQPARALAAPNSAGDRFIIKLRDAAAEPRARISAIGGRNGKRFEYVRAMSGEAHVVRITQGLSELITSNRTAGEARRVVAQQLMGDPDVAYAEPDARMYPLLVPNDAMYSAQWDLYEAAGGINAPAAWDITTGSTSVVAAVIDTGYRPHGDLAGKILPGYDFVADATISNDGDGRDADASDPGDYGSCGNSSWHGTHVSGTIGAASNNGGGISGINWVSKILPARVLGSCGGYTSDIVDAMRWSAGIAVTGVPANPNPARIENLSLGGSGSCSNTFQSAINDVVARGTVVVVAAGNENTDAANTQPASCNNVITVGATTRTGGRATFSNYGAKVTISAPGVSILSTLNSGTTTPGSDSYAYYSGTSMATPHVVGVVSLMLSQNPALTPAQVKARLQATARAFPTGTGSDCTTALCGSGIVDAGAALVATSTAPRVNLAASSVGTSASASSSYNNGYPPSGANNGDRKGSNGGRGGYWNDSTPNAFPDWIQLNFPASRNVNEIDVFSVQDSYQNPQEPTESMTFALYGLVDFDVQYWNGSTWVTVPGGAVTGNNLVWRKVTFPTVSTTALRVTVRNALGTWSRVAEIEAYGDAPPLNFARPANGGSAVASTIYNDGYAATGAIDGDRRGLNAGNGGYWNDSTPHSFPDFLQVNFNATRTINEIDVFGVQDNYQSPDEPTPTMTFSQYGLVDFDVQYWNGSAWATVPNGSINGNNLVWRKVTFPAVSTTAIRITVRNTLDSWSRIAEVEAYFAP